ncbi:MAG: UvrD-helicase domain-containing protein [Chloroflexi bacterium]|nr:UvrD-helicase domain-containing protein [Chloroflexota bacterium]
MEHAALPGGLPLPVEPLVEEPPPPDAPPPDDDPFAAGPDPRDAARDRGLATGAGSREELEARIVSRLNPDQARAVTATEGPVLIFAGAGSGKTRVIAHRVAYLVGVKGVAPWRILAVTFTNKAAAEMRTRIVGLVGPDDAGRVAMGTFHALCARILRADGSAIGIAPRFVIYDTDDQLTLMKQVFREDDRPLKGERISPRRVLDAVSLAKNELLDPDALGEGADGRLPTRERAEIAALGRRYQERLRAAGALDFDDLLVECVRLLETVPDVLERYRSRWRYLHVDEYQDTNRAQYRLVAALAARHRNLCVVGDDDQSIYAWRGADLRNILDFERDWPDATVIKLEQNYRSTQRILDAAHAVVEKNAGRSDKRLWTDNPEGPRIRRFEASSEEEEAEWIARRIEELVSPQRGSLTRRADEGAGFEPGEVAVMYRTNAQSRALEEALLRYSIRYQLIGGVRFYERREVKDALAYLRLLRSDGDVVAFERVINVPGRSIGDRTLEILRLAAADAGSYWAAIERAAAGDLPVLLPRARTALAGFAGLVRHLRARVGVLPLPELLDEVLEASGYRAMLADGSEEGEERWRNLLELRSVTTRYDGLAPMDALDRLLEEAALVADQDELEDDPDLARGRVTLITLHAAKGLEFRVVFMAGLEEGLLPHARAIEAQGEAELEEERRLAYVGMTRARERLFLTHAMSRAFRGGSGFIAVPSRFLLDIPAHLLDGPLLVERMEDLDLDIDPELAFGARRSSRLGAAIRAGGGAYRSGSGRPGAPAPGQPFRPSRDLAARRDASAGRRGGGAVLTSTMGATGCGRRRPPAPCPRAPVSPGSASSATATAFAIRASATGSW